MWSIVDVCINSEKGCSFSANLKLRGVMEHPMGNFITSLYGEAKHPQGSFTKTAVITPQKVFMKHLCFYSDIPSI